MDGTPNIAHLHPINVPVSNLSPDTPNDTPKFAGCHRIFQDETGRKIPETKEKRRHLDGVGPRWGYLWW